MCVRFEGVRFWGLRRLRLGEETQWDGGILGDDGVEGGKFWGREEGEEEEQTWNQSCQDGARIKT